MKKTILSLMAACLLCGSAATAQEAKPAVRYTPEAGDFAVGVDLVPLFRTIGGAFNDSETPVGGKPFEYDDMYSIRPDVSIIGKYMLTDSWGLKVNLGVRLRHKTNRAYVQDDLQAYLNPVSDVQVIDVAKTTQSGGSLMAGAEYRIGHRRVQGIVGFGVLFGFSTNEDRYTYGNKITSFNQQPSQALGYTYNGGRVLSCNNDGPNFAAGAYGSLGAEWFVAPKVALGAEVNLSLYGVFGSKAVVKSELYNDAYQAIEERTDVLSPGNRGINFGTDNIGGALYCTFYF